MIEINVLSEFERCGIKWDWAGEKEIKIRCPFHDDKQSPNCCVNVETRAFICHAAQCLEKGSVLKLLARMLNTTQHVLLQDLSKRYNSNTDKVIPAETVQRYHQQIWAAKPLLQQLYIRGLDDFDIRQHRLGENEGRITIPVPNQFGEYVNIRRYLPGAPGKDKMRNQKGYSKPRWFPIDQLKYPDIVLTGGECKAIVGARQLNPHNVGCLCITAGEGAWNADFLRDLKGKNRVWLAMDIDTGGRKAANMLCLQIRTVADWVGDLLLPLDKDKYPKGDINDFIGIEKGQLFPLLLECPEYIPTVIKAEYNDDTPPIQLELSQAFHADKTGKRVELSAVISTMDTSPYIIPADVEILCDKDQRECAVCQVFIQNNSKFTINPESPAVLEMVAAGSREAQLPVVKNAVGIPRTCKACAFQSVTHYNVEDTRISPQLEISAQVNGAATADRFMQPAYCIGNGLDLNESYTLTGRMFPHPKTQQATLLVSKYKPTQDALRTYKVNAPEELGIFWPDVEWSTEAVARKLSEIYTDFSDNVTRIYQREELHLAVDLTYHSPIGFTFDGKRCKGWVETLIVGDSSQGKSEVTCGQDGNGGLKAHFGLGTRVECKNATVAGLLGGCADAGNKRWFVTWGIIPNNDLRLVIMEEIKGTSTEVLGKLTDARSSGIAEIPKIERRKTHCRTRLIVPSNPRSNLKMHQYSFGVQAALELMGNPEDLRRFDWVFILSENDIDEVALNAYKPSAPHVYTSELCRRLILWGWTRKPDQIIFTDDAKDLILQRATDLCGKFTSAIPICDKTSMKYKLARLAAACAVRTFSCSEDYESVIVQYCHADYIANRIEELYSRPSFGYLDYTRAIGITQTLLDPDIVKLKINETAYPKDLCQSLLAATAVDLHDLQDWCALNRDDALQLMSLFVRKHCLMRSGKTHYRKTGQFISLLREMIDKNLCVKRPDHIRNF